MTMGFRKKVAKDPNHKFINRAYYITIGDKLYSDRPYFGWHVARRAAKRVRSDAFIICGSTLNRKLDQIRIAAHKQQWSAYGAR